MQVTPVRMKRLTVLQERQMLTLATRLVAVQPTTVVQCAPTNHPRVQTHLPNCGIISNSIVLQAMQLSEMGFRGSTDTHPITLVQPV